jgi:hypothetical protein
MNALFGAAVFGLVPVPMMPAYYTDMRSYSHRSITTDDVNDAALMGLPDDIIERTASRDELTRIWARVLPRLRVPS